MLKYINSIPDEYEEQLNIPLMNKEYDKPLVEYIFDALKGFEILPNIKIIDYTWDDKETNFDINDHVIRRNKNKNKVIKNIADTRCGVMYVTIEVSGKDKNDNYITKRFVKPIIIPLQDKHGYYMIKGKKCYLIYQMVDKMLYPSMGAVTVKSLMPICIKTQKDKFTDTNGNEYTIPVYTIQIFKNAINVLLIYSNIATDKMLKFLEIDRFVKVEDKNEPFEEDPNIIRFNCGKKSDIRIAVMRDIFEKEIYVQSMVGCLIKLFDESKIQYKDRNNFDEWMIVVGGKNTIKRGIYQHIFFNRLLDDVTRKELKINDYDKQNIYYLLRYTLENFHKLWSDIWTLIF